MALGGNKSASGNYMPFMGYAKFKVLAFNPSNAEVKALNDEKGTSFYVNDEERSYTGVDSDGVRFSDVVAYMYNEEKKFSTTLGFRIAAKVVESSTNKIQVINGYGQVVWVPSEEEIPEAWDWFLRDAVRKAASGEEDLTNFLSAFLNTSIKKKDPCQLNIDKVLEGDYSELKAALEGPGGNNSIGILLTVIPKEKDEKIVYKQGFFRRKFEKGWSKDLSYLQKSVDSYLENAVSNTAIFPDFPYTLERFSVESTTEEPTSEAPTNIAGTAKKIEKKW